MAEMRNKVFHSFGDNRFSTANECCHRSQIEAIEFVDASRAKSVGKIRCSRMGAAKTGDELEPEPWMAQKNHGWEHNKLATEGQRVEHGTDQSHVVIHG